MPNPLELIVRYVIVLALALIFAAALEGPAAAFPLNQHVSPGELKSHCDAVGGEYGGALGHYWCQSPNGNEVDCDKKKCYGYVALTSDGKGVPCDPMFCKIFCGGQPYCPFRTQTVQVAPALPVTAPTGSLSSFSGGASAPMSPAGVP